MTTTISIPFEEHEDSPVERGDRDSGFQFARIFLCNWDDRFTFLTEMFTGGVAGRPKAYHNSFPQLLCSGFDVERIANRPMGPDSITDPESQFIDHETLAKIRIDYAPLVFNNSSQMQPGTWATYNRSSSIEFINVPARKMKWESSGEPLPADTNPVIPVATTRHEVTWHQVLNPPWGLIDALKGKANSATFFVPATQRSIPPEQLLLLEDSSRQTVRYDGSASTELTLVFVEKQQKILTGNTYGWNHKLNPEPNGGYDRPVAEDTGDYLFATANLNQIFA